MGFFVALFIYSKVFELVDTLWLTLRKAPVIFLHWYHHVTVPLDCSHSNPSCHPHPNPNPNLHPNPSPNPNPNPNQARAIEQLESYQTAEAERHSMLQRLPSPRAPTPPPIRQGRVETLREQTMCR